jgi:hypothetical protein
MASRYERKSPAFTLWETLVGIVITSLIVTFSYGAYRILARLPDSDRNEMEDLHEMMLVERELFRSVQSCRSMELIDNTIYFNQSGHLTGMVFLDNSMVLIKDTGDPGDDMEYPVNEWTVSYLAEDSDYISFFAFNYVLERNAFRLSFSKSYPRGFLYSIMVK